MKLGELVGQDAARGILQSAVRMGRVSHAWLFYGPEGSGKRTAAVAFAQALNCPDKEDGDACGRCAVCRRVDHGNEPDVRYFEPQSDKKNYSLKDEVRPNIIPEAYLSPIRLPRKAVIVDRADRLSQEAANAMLKPIEEPSRSVVFILLALDLWRMLPTIRSRCLTVPFRALGPEDMAVLHERKTGRRPQEDEARLACLLASGSLSEMSALLEGRELESIGEDLKVAAQTLLERGGGRSPARFANLLMAFARRVEEASGRPRQSDYALAERALGAVLDFARPPYAGDEAAILSRVPLMETILEAQRALRGNANVTLTLENLYLQNAG